MPTEQTYPYTFDHLRHFKKEIEEAGGTDELMFRKRALKRKNGMLTIVKYPDIERYKEKYLIGVYESLRPIYTTEVPYVFWSKLYAMLNRI